MSSAPKTPRVLYSCAMTNVHGCTVCMQIYQPTLESTELADRNRKPPFAFNLSMIICVLQFANCLGFYPGLHRPTSRVIRCHGSPKFISYGRTEGAGPTMRFKNAVSDKIQNKHIESFQQQVSRNIHWNSVLLYKRSDRLRMTQSCTLPRRECASGAE